jgi:hypothetical protein
VPDGTTGASSSMKVKQCRKPLLSMRSAVLTLAAGSSSSSRSSYAQRHPAGLAPLMRLPFACLLCNSLVTSMLSERSDSRQALQLSSWKPSPGSRCLYLYLYTFLYTCLYLYVYLNLCLAGALPTLRAENLPGRVHHAAAPAAGSVFGRSQASPPSTLTCLQRSSSAADPSPPPRCKPALHRNPMYMCLSTQFEPCTGLGGLPGLMHANTDSLWEAHDPGLAAHASKSQLHPASRTFS